MKRFIVTTILTVVIAGVLALYMPRSFDSYITQFGDDATVAIYCRQTELDCVDMGTGYKVQCDAKSFSQAVIQCRAVDGISVSFAGSLSDMEQISKFFRLRVYSVYEQDGLYVVCGKSSKIRNGVLDGGNVVNLQIAYNNGVICIGSPMILGDY